MFKVVSKETGITYDVFAVRGNEFLIFFNNKFEWYSMGKFRPTRTTEEERIKKELEEEGVRRKDIFKSTRDKDRYNIRP